MSNDSTTTIFLFILMAVAFYFLMIRPQRKRQRRQQETIASLTPGSRIMLSSGIYATLVDIREADADVELAPGCVVTVVRQAISQAAPMPEEEVFVETDSHPSDELDSGSYGAGSYGADSLSAESFSAENLSPDDFRDDADNAYEDFGTVHPRTGAKDKGVDTPSDLDATPTNDDDRRPEGN